MTTKVLDITIDEEKDPQLAAAFTSGLRRVNVRSRNRNLPFVIMPVSGDEEALSDDKLEDLLADKIAQLMISENGLEEALDRLAAMADDPGERVFWKTI